MLLGIMVYLCSIKHVEPFKSYDYEEDLYLPDDGHDDIDNNDDDDQLR